MKRIKILGDFVLSSQPHIATNAAVDLSIRTQNAKIEYEWIRTDAISYADITGSDGFLVAPGSPYRDMTKVLKAIKHAREKGVPVLGTCGGFQHMVLEYAINVSHITGAVHAEYDPAAQDPVIYRLPHSLVGRTLDIHFLPGSQVETLYGEQKARESYFCTFGVNPAYGQALQKNGLRFVGSDSDGKFRAVELDGHPFFCGTLFVPLAGSANTAPHPVVSGFVRAVLNRQ